MDHEVVGTYYNAASVDVYPRGEGQARKGWYIWAAGNEVELKSGKKDVIRAIYQQVTGPKETEWAAMLTEHTWAFLKNLKMLSTTEERVAQQKALKPYAGARIPKPE
jgi:hypothetical protein